MFFKDPLFGDRKANRLGIIIGSFRVTHKYNSSFNKSNYTNKFPSKCSNWYAQYKLVIMLIENTTTNLKKTSKFHVPTFFKFVAKSERSKFQIYSNFDHVRVLIATK